MTVLVLGGGGQLAHDLLAAYDGDEVTALGHGDLDVCNHASVEDRLSEIKPKLVINTAAFHHVDNCEDEPERAFQVNAHAVRNLARVCADLDTVLVHVSTDYVFAGDKSTPHTETDLPRPLGVYAVSKLAGEFFARYVCPRHFVVRSSGLYGVKGASGKGGNFVETMLKVAHEGKPLRVVNDQVLAPTYTKDLAFKMRELTETDRYGLYHIANDGQCSWYEFAAKIFELTGVSADLGPTTTAEFGAKANRPSYSVLGQEGIVSAGLEKLRPWHEALHSYLIEKGHIPE